MNYVFVCGADDPEMEIIRGLVTRRGYHVVQALANGEPVTSKTAYSVDGFTPDISELAGALVWIECAPVDTAIARTIVIDHHHEGDPGYECGAEDFWLGSSLGQICNLIDEPMTTDLMLAAAADHCLSEAYRGRCPGVSPAALREWRLNWRARRRGLQYEQAEERLERAIRVMADLPVIEFMGQQVVDGTGVKNSDLNDAVAISGRALLSAQKDWTTGLLKACLYGASPEATAAWMRYMEKCPQVSSVYGNPHRTYAGAYFKPSVMLTS